MKNKKGFTLVELLAVIAILAILVIMALPAVLRMFNQARVDSFNNELNSVLRTAKQQYLLGGGEPQTWTNAEGSTNRLDLTGNSNFKYSVTMNGQGQITRFQATNGDFQYSRIGIIDIVDKNDIQVVSDLSEGETLTIQNPVVFVTRQNSGQITIGDEVALDTEHFYVISSNSTETVLLAKYNLFVGDIFEEIDSRWAKTGTISSSTPGYGLQNETARGYNTTDSTHRIGTVAFSGSGYWDVKECGIIQQGIHSCSGSLGLKSEYANAANEEGKTSNYSSPYPYVYNSSMSSTAPSYIYNNPYGDAENNGYTIAYYVEGYVNTLKNLGAPNNITGRLLKYEEVSSLTIAIKGTGSYWLGSAIDYTKVWDISRGSLHSSSTLWTDAAPGVRPVIVIPTSDMPN